MMIMFIIVMFVVNPLIDGGNGLSVIKLQLSFNKEVGIEIINMWGEGGRKYFKYLIFTDYIYAFSYSLFFASLLSRLLLKKGKAQIIYYKWIVYLAFFAGLLDWIENSIELFFIYAPSSVSTEVFFLHSVFSTLKWASIPIAIAYILVLITKKNVNHSDI